MTITVNKLIRTTRRSLSLEIGADASLIVRAPKRLSSFDIQTFINKKSSWIIKKQDLTKQKNAQVRTKQFVTGEKFLFLGQFFPLYLIENTSKKLYFSNAFYLSSKAQPKAKDNFAAWYKKQAKELFTRRAVQLGKQYGIKFNSLKISSANKRWGSCTHRNDLNFTWKLVLAPLPVVDYVIVHELAHVKHKDHSRRFWDDVKKMCPEYKLHKKWIKDKGHLLTI